MNRGAVNSGAIDRRAIDRGAQNQQVNKPTDQQIANPSSANEQIADRQRLLNSSAFSAVKRKHEPD
jgi:hypothetical protein